MLTYKVVGLIVASLILGVQGLYYEINSLDNFVSQSSTEEYASTADHSANDLYGNRILKKKEKASDSTSSSGSLKMTKAPKRRRRTTTHDFSDHRFLKKKEKAGDSQTGGSGSSSGSVKMTKAPKRRRRTRRTNRRGSRELHSYEDVALRESYDQDMKTVVVYTGPTSMDSNKGKNWLYLKNFDYFLDHGIDCEHHDTVLVLTESVADHYEKKVNNIIAKCKAADDEIPVRVVVREDKCYDMEGLRSTFEQVDLSFYDFLVYINCGVVGPKLPSPEENDTSSSVLPWTHRYTSLLSEEVKMSGLSINCDVNPHVQSMLFAVDRVGLDIIRNSGAVYDCKKGNDVITDEEKMDIIMKYEIGLSRAILDAGYGIRSTHSISGPTEVFPEDVFDDLTWCNRDMWYVDEIPLTSDTTWEDFMLFKVSRMLLLPDMEKELEYAHADMFETLALPSDEIDADSALGRLWVGGVDSLDLDVSVVISHCRGRLDWLLEYLEDLNYHRIVVVSKCGVSPEEEFLPEDVELVQLPNVGRVDHTMAHWMAEEVTASFYRNDEVTVFLKDNLEVHQLARQRTMSEILSVASSNGFACLQEPSDGMSQFHQTDILTRLNMTQYDGVPKYRSDGSRIIVNSNKDFKSKFKNMAAWLSDVGISLQAPVAPVCYGGMYAVKTSRIAAVPISSRMKLVSSLARGDNIEEGHFAERTWAALLSRKYTFEEMELIRSHAKHVNVFVAPDGGGHLGALMTHDIFGPPKDVLGLAMDDPSLFDWTVNDEGQRVWPSKYRAKVEDSDNVCKRPIVEPSIPKHTPGADAAAPKTVAVCTAMKSELRYVNEWIDFYVVLGVAQFYLYDNAETPVLETYLNATRGPSFSSYVTVIHWPGERQQNEQLTHCNTVAARRDNHTWVANFDADQFLVLRKHEHIVSMLEERCRDGSIGINSYAFAPDLPEDADRELSGDIFDGKTTYQMTARMTPYGLARPLSQRNLYRGKLGWEGTEVSRKSSICIVLRFNTMWRKYSLRISQSL